MADFHQNGSVATLHNFSRMKKDDLENRLRSYASKRKISLILPSLYSELEAPALDHIVNELAGADYVNHVIIGLDRATEDQFRHAQEYFSRLPQNHDILWNDGPRMKAIHEKLSAEGLAPEEPGKGRNVWYCMGYALASQNSDVIALHDCDITTYNREMLARLVYPVTDPNFPYHFCKGYYPRIADGKLNGRVCRLLVTPLLMAFEKTCGQHAYLDYLQGFRYPLAGEFAMRTSIVPDMRIPSDWGLEIGVLSEVWRNLSNRSVCQVDISDAYDHKHQDLSKEDASKGLSRMSVDITKALFRKLATDGVTFSMANIRTVKATYFRIALDMVEIYQNDARMNGMETDRHKEEEAVELFAANIMVAGETYLANPMETPFIPNWSRIQSADPDIIPGLREAVMRDKEPS